MVLDTPKNGTSAPDAGGSSASHRASEDAATNGRRWLMLGVLAYTVIRVLLVMLVESYPGGISHDSAYILTAARNVLAGRGLVNDAHWLVFLSPSQLPVAFHNANPLYPLVIALLSGLTGLSVEHSGFVVSAVSSGAAAAALALLLDHFGVPGWRAAVITAVGVLVPPVFASSLHVLPDALWHAFALWFVACVVRASRAREFALSGALFGLAWLTRSTALLLLPGIACLVLGRLGARQGTRALALVGATAALVASPWLLHTHLVWGNPFRSDSSYYLLQNYVATARGQSLSHFWHSPTPPPGLTEIIRADAGGFLQYWISGLPDMARTVAREWGMGSPEVALVLGAAVVVLLILRVRAHRSLHVLAAAIYAATLVLVFAGRSQYGGFEIRYAILAGSLAAAMVAWLGLDALGPAPAGRRRSAASLVLMATACVWVIGIPPAMARRWREEYGEQRALRDYVHLAHSVARNLDRSAPVVVGSKPYYFTWATGIPSLSIPSSDERYLERYMEKFGAATILLTPTELTFWRPDWQHDKGRPAFLESAGRPGGAYLFVRQMQPTLVQP